MIKGIERLAPLPEGEWKRVTDITIPLIEDPGKAGAPRADIGGAFCFAGSSKAYRFLETSNTGSFLRSKELMDAVSPHHGQGKRRFRVNVGENSFRVQVGTHADGSDLQLRVLPEEAPSLAELQMPAAWRELMLSEDLLEGGLVLIVAPPGQGKTTTASAMVRSRLEVFGGHANTVEDPIELPLQGVWGDGICIQRPADAMFEMDRPGEGYYRGLLEALRQYPAVSGGATTLFVGEIRDPLTAAETLKAASNGHLVVATMHAKSIDAAVARLISLATGGDGMLVSNVREMLSENLRAVFYQRLMWKLDGESLGWSSANVSGSVLWSEGYESKVAAAIRDAALSKVRNLAQRQTDAVLAMESGQPEATVASVTELLKAAVAE